MADDYVQVAPDSTGKKIDNTTETTGAGTVERQRVSVAAVGSNNQLGIDTNGNLGVSAATITSIPSISMTAGTVTSMPAVSVSAATITSIPSISMSAGTITSLPNVTISAGTVGAATVTSISAGTVSANQGTGSTANPWAQNLIQVGGTTIAATAKGTQAANFIPVQQARDSGRTFLNFTADNIAAVSAEALATVTINKAGTTSSASTYSVTAGKTLRLISFECGNVLTTTTMVQTRVRLRAVNGTPTTASPIIDSLSVSPASAAANAVGWTDGGAMPDGIEIPGGWGIALSHISSSTSANVAISLNGFEY